MARCFANSTLKSNQHKYYESPIEIVWGNVYLCLVQIALSMGALASGGAAVHAGGRGRSIGGEGRLVDVVRRGVSGDCDSGNRRLRMVLRKTYALMIHFS